MEPWNLQIAPIWKGKWSEPNIHDYVQNVNLEGGTKKGGWNDEIYEMHQDDGTMDWGLISDFVGDLFLKCLPRNDDDDDDDDDDNVTEQVRDGDRWFFTRRCLI